MDTPEETRIQMEMEEAPFLREVKKYGSGDIAAAQEKFRNDLTTMKEAQKYFDKVDKNATELRDLLQADGVDIGALNDAIDQHHQVYIAFRPYIERNIAVLFALVQAQLASFSSVEDLQRKFAGIFAGMAGREDEIRESYRLATEKVTEELQAAQHGKVWVQVKQTVENTAQGLAVMAVGALGVIGMIGIIGGLLYVLVRVAG